MRAYTIIHGTPARMVMPIVEEGDGILFLKQENAETYARVCRSQGLKSVTVVEVEVTPNDAAGWEVFQ